MKLLLFSVLLCIFAACGNNSDSSNDNDTGSTASTDTSKAPATPAQEVKVTDTVQAVSLAIDLNCEQAQNRVVQGVGNDIREFNMALAKLAECGAKEFNAKHPDSTRVTVMTEETDASGETKILFNTITYKTGEKIAEAAKALIALGTFGETVDPLTTLISTSAGDYMVDSYLNSAAKNDPLIIFFPTVIPGKQLTQDIYNSVTKTKAAKTVIKVEEKVKDEVKKDPTVLNPPIHLNKKALSELNRFRKKLF